VANNDTEDINPRKYPSICDPESELKICNAHSINGGIEALQNVGQKYLVDILNACTGHKADNINGKIPKNPNTDITYRIPSPELINQSPLGYLHRKQWKVDVSPPNSNYLKDFLDFTPYSVHNVPEYNIPSPHNSIDDRKVGNITVDAINSGIFLEVQLGKYAFIAENLCYRFPLLQTLSDDFRVGVEIVPTDKLQKKMVTGSGNFSNAVAAGQVGSERMKDYPPIVILGIGFEGTKSDIYELSNSHSSTDVEQYISEGRNQKQPQLSSNQWDVDMSSPNSIRFPKINTNGNDETDDNKIQKSLTDYTDNKYA